MLCAFGSVWEYMMWPIGARLLAAWLIDFIVEFAIYGMVVGADLQAGWRVPRRGGRPSYDLSRRLTGREIGLELDMIARMTTDAKPKAGLEDVVAATSAICYLDGDRGVLAYYGYDIHDLARGASFEEVCYLLWHGRLPNRAELGDLQSQLAAARPLSEPILRLMKQLPPSDGMDVLRTLTSALGQYDPEAADNSQPANYRKAVRLTAQLASLVATYGRLQAGGGPIQPDPALGHAANFLYMLTGKRPNALSTRAFDVALVLHADHELNASTFAARVAAATLTDHLLGRRRPPSAR